MHAYLVVQGTEQLRKKSILALCEQRGAHTFDTIQLEPLEKSIGIEDVRTFLTRIHYKPIYGACSVAIIYKADVLTTEAQNALLKTLEEPNPSLIIILETQRESFLLSTIISRCQIIRLAYSSNPEVERIQPFFQDMITEKSLGKRLQMVEIITSTRENSISWIVQSIEDLRSLLYNYYKSNATPISSQNLSPMNIRIYLRNLLKALQMIEQNVSIKASIDGIFYSK